MKFRLIYPKWPKLSSQTEWHLPPHGPVVFAACVPAELELRVHRRERRPGRPRRGRGPGLHLDDAHLPGPARLGASPTSSARAGSRSIFGGISTMLHAEETAAHADAVFLGEAEGRFEGVLDDLRAGPAQEDLRLPRHAGAGRVGGHGAPVDPRPRRLQLPRRADGGPGPRLARLPLQLLPVLRAATWAGARSGRGPSTGWWRRWPPSPTTGCSSSTTRWRRTRSGSWSCSRRWRR